MALSIRSTIRVYAQHVRKYKGMAVGLWLTVIFLNIANLYGPILTKQFFDILSDKNLDKIQLSEALFHVLLWITGLSVLRWAIFRVAAFLNNYFAACMLADLQASGFSTLLDRSYRFFTNTFAGALTRKVGRFARAFETLIDQVVWRLTQVVVIVVGDIIIFYQRNVYFAIILGLWTLFFIVTNTLFSQWKLKFDTAKAEIDSEVSGSIADALSNSVTIMQFTGKTFEYNLVGNVLERFRKAQITAWNWGGINDALQWGLMVVLEFLTMYFGIKLFIADKITLGDFALIQTSLFILYDHLWDFGHMIRSIYEAFADAKEMVDIIDEPLDITDKPGAEPLEVGEGAIEFTDVSFGYSAQRLLISHLSFAIKGREKVAFVGTSGAGKSTLVKLVMRFYDIRTGTIRIDGQSISDITLDSLRKAVALVPQDPILFHRSLMENIRYGRRDATDAEVIEAAKKAHCHEFITRMPDGYQTLVGERGVRLSGGERQRVAIARAILRNAPILILDEATSSLDSESEVFIQDALRELMHNKTVIVIAHRLSTIMQMDRILVIERGHVIDQGTHEELFKKEGRYSKLWEIQAGGFKAK